MTKTRPLTTKIMTSLCLISALTIVNTPASPPPSTLSATTIANQLQWVSSPDQQCKGYFQQPDAVTSIDKLDSIDATPTTITAKGATTFNKDGSTSLDDHVIVSQPGRILQADHATIYRDTASGQIKRIQLSGHIKVIQPGAIAIGSYAESYPQTHQTLIKNTLFHFSLHDHAKNFWGIADSAHEDVHQNRVFTSATISMCPPDNPTWKIQAKK